MDIEPWIEAASADPVEYSRRQAVHVLIWAISYSDVFPSASLSKGGDAYESAV